MNIGQLYRFDKPAWCAEFFPEYHDIFRGYPKGVQITYYDPWNPPLGPKMGRTKKVYETNPWEFAQVDGGDIQPNGTRFINEVYQDHNGLERTRPKAVPVSEEEFRRWCDENNWFRRGDAQWHLDPRLLIGAFDVRTEQYQLRDRQAIVTCPSGIYTYSEGPSTKHPFGVNATFTPHGATGPSWVERRWGPDYRPEFITLGSGHIVRFWPEGLVKPSQAQYDAERTPRARGLL